MTNALVNIRETRNLAVSAEQKEREMLTRLAQCSSIIVALSGGADSAYLAWAAQHALGERALSVTALSPSFSAYDRTMVEDFVRKLGVRHEFVETHEMDNPAYRANATDRCYFCKDELFSVLDQLATERKFEAVCYGVNADDTLDFRPGHRAASEHRVLAPLLDAGLTKAEIRTLSERAGLPTWDRPASACLSSRNADSPRSTSARRSGVTSVPYGKREDKQADAGRSHSGSPARSDNVRISAFVSPASSNAASTRCSVAAP